MKSLLIKLPVLLALLALPLHAPAKSVAKKPVVQIAILIDTSNSMDGLIEQAKSQLWKISNEFIKASQDGVAPDVQVALYEYGKSSLSGKEGHIRQILPLTTDLDKVSEELFALRTNGGEEYCGWVIQRAVEELEWSTAADAYKVIFIAGNEPFTQGPVKYAAACKSAITKGIIVNTIHCGPENVGRETKWRDGAELADGKYLVIDHNRAVVSITAPQDKEIAKLGVELNKTYIAYGRGGAASAARQEAQDGNAAALAPSSGATVNRSIAKASGNYQNSSWDLVDASKAKDFDIKKLKAEELPPAMKKMNTAEQQAHIEKNARMRGDLQKKINDLNVEREKYIAAQTKSAASSNTLDAVVITTVRSQAESKRFTFK